MANKKFNQGELLNIHDSGVMSEDQLRAFLFASWHYLVKFSKDRRGGHCETDQATGLPVSANDLQPTFRAIRGRDLALSTILPPKSFVLSILRTDEIPENVGLPHDQREWRCLAMVPPDTWSEETLHAVSVNTRRFKLLLAKLEAEGLVDTKPQIDETAATLGTKNLEHGDDGFTLGFRPLNKGLDAADEFVRDHTFFSRQLRLEEWLGRSMAMQAPEWKQAQERDEARA
jgi:hypothetical protein